MGTTRMHPDPTQGVVDTNQRVHGIANLYVAGAAVYPTAGCVNPTLTLVALTLRLSDHLRRTI
jgi:choline dehydrogenase-like flavoprotein